MNTQQQHSRRDFLKAAALSAAATGLLTMRVKAQVAPGSGGMEFTLFYQPTKLRERGAERTFAWDLSFTVKDGKLMLAVPVVLPQKGGRTMGLAIAESDDGVHWRETESFACPLKDAAPGFCWRYTGKEFVYFVTENNRGADRKDYRRIMRQYRSPDLKSWEVMGDEYTTRPDKRWYLGRWDELHIVEDAGTFYGYITAIPRPELAQGGLGMLKSADGVRWEVLPPAALDRDGLPSQHMEVSFCEKINGRYYLGMGARAYLGHFGYSVLTFVSDSPTGPFHPDKEALRLCGTTTRDLKWLTKSFYWKDELLCAEWITPPDLLEPKRFGGIGPDGSVLWTTPLRKLIVDKAGHLRMAWWPGNEAAKGAVLPVSLREVGFAHPAEKHRGVRSTLSVPAADAVALHAGRDGAIALLPTAFDFHQGVMIEGTLKAKEPRGEDASTHWNAAAAGFFFEESPGKGMLLQLETLGLTRIGRFEYQPEPAFEADEFRYAAPRLVIKRGGDYLGLSRFTQEDVIGPIGYASPCGIHNATPHRFRLLVKNGMFEFYLDDLLVQTYLTGATSGRLGLFAKSGSVEFTDLRFCAMTPDVKGK